jgi:hypothetical protein
MNSRQKRKVVDDLGLVTGNRDREAKAGSAPSAGRSPTVCVSPIENAQSQAPKNVVIGKYQRRKDMTAPLRMRCTKRGSFAVDLVVSRFDEHEFLLYQSRPAQTCVTAPDSDRES